MKPTMPEIPHFEPNKIVKACRQGMSEWHKADAFNPEFHPEFDILQPKMDGWWVLVLFRYGTCYLLTSGAEIREWFPLPPEYKNCWATFVAEWMYGTNWSQAEELAGKFYFFDVREFILDTVQDRIIYDTRKFPDIVHSHYHERLAFLLKHRDLLSEMTGGKGIVIPTFPRTEIERIWNDPIHYEGVVLKRSNALFAEKGSMAKVKRTFTMDYVCISIVEGSGRLKGRMGAMVGGVYVDGKLVPMIAVGGGYSDKRRQEIWDNQEQFLGKVFEAEGKGLFRHAVLRHPVFKQWREDKLPEMCVPINEPY